MNNYELIFGIPEDLIEDIIEQQEKKNLEDAMFGSIMAEFNDEMLVDAVTSNIER